MRASLRNDKRWEGEGRERQKIENKVPTGGLKAPSSSYFQGHRLLHEECLAKTPVPSGVASCAAGSACVTSSRSACSLPLQDSQPALSLTTLPFSHEQRREALRQNGQTSWVGFNHGGPYVLKYPDILGLRLKEQSQLSRRKSSLLRSEREVLLQAFAKRLGGFLAKS